MTTTPALYLASVCERTAAENGLLGDSSPNDQKGFLCVRTRTKRYEDKNLSTPLWEESPKMPLPTAEGHQYAEIEALLTCFFDVL